MLFAQFNGNGIGSNLEWNERLSLKNSSIYGYALDMVERIKN